MTTLIQPISCFTCEIDFISSPTPFSLFQCSMCKEKTAYCSRCTSIMLKLLGEEGFFKCSLCNSINSAISKEEIISDTRTLQVRNSQSLKTPLKISPLSPNKNTSHLIMPSLKFQTPKENQSSYKEIDSQLEQDFTKKVLVTSPGEEEKSKQNIKEDAFILKYNLLSTKKKSTPIKKNISLNTSRDNSLSYSEFSGYNKKAKKSPIANRVKQFVLRQENWQNNKAPSAQFASPMLKNIQFCNGFDNQGNNKFLARFGERCQIGNPRETPHKFLLPNFD